MKKKKLLAFAVACVLSTLLVSTAFAMGGRPGERVGKERIFERMSKEVSLTPEQKNKFKAKLDSSEKEIKEIWEKNRELHKKIADEIKKDKPDISAINKYIDQVGLRSTEIHKIRMKTILEIRNELTPGQREKFKKMHDRIGERPKYKDGRESPAFKEKDKKGWKLTPEQIKVLKDLTPEEIEMVKQMKEKGFPQK